MADQHHAKGNAASRHQSIQHGQYGPPDSVVTRSDKRVEMGRGNRQLQQERDHLPAVVNKRDKAGKQ